VSHPVGHADTVKRVTFVELYFDLIFVFAARQAAHVIIDEPTSRGVLAALGLFIPLWWTWIGFVMLYNLRGEDRISHRLFVLAGTIPCAIAAIEVHGAIGGHTVGFSFALAGARAVLAFAFAFTSDQRRRIARRISLRYAISTALFVISALLPLPWRYVFWGLALAQEAGLLLTEARERSKARRGKGDWNEDERDGQARDGVDRDEALAEAFAAPARGELQVNAHHLAERFGLFMIIMLGEIVISVGSAAIVVHHPGVHYWLALLSGLILAAALWWVYFTSAVEIDEYVLRATGGNPAMAYGLYAGGHLLPAFGLLVIAAGVALALEEDPSRAAAWLITGGLAAYLAGTRAVSMVGRLRFGRFLRLVAVTATVCLALLQVLISPAGVLMVATMWTVGVAIVVSSQRRFVLSQVVADPLHYFRRD
jgi:low temperature requirement protein LtrA